MSVLTCLEEREAGQRWALAQRPTAALSQQEERARRRVLETLALDPLAPDDAIVGRLSSIPSQRLPAPLLAALDLPPDTRLIEVVLGVLGLLHKLEEANAKGHGVDLSATRERLGALRAIALSGSRLLERTAMHEQERQARARAADERRDAEAHELARKGREALRTRSWF